MTKRKSLLKERVVNYEKYLADLALPLGQGLAQDPQTIRSQVFPLIEKQLEIIHHGQVVLLEEAQQIMDIATNIVRFFCACRSGMYGKYLRLCFGVCAFKSDFLPIGFLLPYTDFSENFEVLTPDEAKKELEKLAQRGLVHTVWTALTPFITTLCNCIRRDCFALRARLESDIKVVWKGEHVASIDIDKCNGCKECLKMCNFGGYQFLFFFKEGFCQFSTLLWLWGLPICL